MTVWLDTGWVRSQIAEAASSGSDDYEIIDEGVENGRGRITVVFDDGFTMTTHDINRWGEMLGGLRTTDPEIEVESVDGKVQVSVTADEAGYREE